MVKHIVASAVFLLFFASAYPVSAVDLHYSTGKTYGAIRQQPVIEIPTGTDAAIAQELYSLFAVSKPYLKLVDPPSTFTSSSVFSTYDSFAGGWYLTLTPGSSSLDIISSFSGRTSHPIVAEITSYDASFIRTVKSRFPSVKVHAGHYLFWPREEVKNAFAQTPPPAMEAVSIWFEETSSDMFASVKLLFDTMFDASNDIAGTSNVKIGYPSNSLLALSDIRPKFPEESRKTALRMGIAGGAAVTYVQTQGKGGKAPIKYIGLGRYEGMSAKTRTLVAHYVKFLSMNPEVIWPMSMGGNGDPYDNPFISDSNSKPIVGVIGVISGKPEGVVVNTSGQNVSVSLPGDPGSSSAYSSVIGNFAFSSSFQMTAYEAIVFGANSSNTKSSTPPPPIVQPTNSPKPSIKPTADVTPVVIPTTPLSASIFPTSPEKPQPSATPVYFPMGGSVEPQPSQSPPFPSGELSIKILAQVKKGLRLVVVKTNPLLVSLTDLFFLIKKYDMQLEDYINTSLHRLTPALPGP